MACLSGYLNSDLSPSIVGVLNLKQGYMWLLELQASPVPSPLQLLAYLEVCHASLNGMRLFPCGETSHIALTYETHRFSTLSKRSSFGGVCLVRCTVGKTETKWFAAASS